MRSLLLVVLVVVSPTVSFALEYPCPSDPGFCYLDVGNDGCFDGDTDTGPIDDHLESGDYNTVSPVVGSIVCPPSVSGLNITSADLDMKWMTTGGGHVRLYATALMKPTGGKLNIFAEGDILLGGTLHFSTDARAGGDVSLHSDAWIAPFIVAGGHIDIAPGVRIRAGFLGLAAEAGGVTFGDKVRIRCSQLQLLGGSVHASNLQLTASGDIRVWGTSWVAEGFTKLKTKPGGGILLSMTDEVTFDRLLAKTSTYFAVTGSELAVSSPDGKPSRVQVGKNGAVSIDVSGVVSLDKVDLRVGEADPFPNEVVGASISHTRGKLRGRAGTSIMFDAAGACDVTETVVKKTALIMTCDTVVGPQQLETLR